MIKTSSFQAQAQFRRHFFLFSLLLSGIGFLFYGVPELLAQAAPDVLADGDDDGPATMFDNVKQAGLWMVPLVIASIAMVALIVYNFIQLTTAKFKPEDLKMALLDHMANCRVRSAIEVSSTSPTYLGRMMASALPNVDATDPDTLGREDVEDAVAEFTIRENRMHMTWIGYLGVIGQIAPMLGLLGTVVGMMGAFNTIGTQGQADPSALAEDIGLAMVTTASGLIIAIPSVFFFFFLRNRFNGLVAGCHQDMSDMLDASHQAVNADQAMAKIPEGLQAG